MLRCEWVKGLPAKLLLPIRCAGTASLDKPRPVLAQLQDTVRGALLNSPTGFDRVPVGSSSMDTWPERGWPDPGTQAGRALMVTLLAEGGGTACEPILRIMCRCDGLAYETQIKR